MNKKKYVWFVCTDNPWGIDDEEFFFTEEEADNYYNSLISDNSDGDETIVHMCKSHIKEVK